MKAIEELQGDLERWRKAVFELAEKRNLETINFQLTLIGCMLLKENQSLYEVLQSSHRSSVIGRKNLTTSETIDRTVDPL